MMWKRRGERSGRPLQTAMRGCLPAMMLGLLLPVAALRAQTKTTVTDTVHAPDGSLPSGQIVISANSTFTAADGTVVFQGTVATVTVTKGSFSVALIPNAGSTPSGTSYSAIYKLAGVSYRDETWVVPSSATAVDLSAVRSAKLSGPSEMVAASQLPAVISSSAILDKGGQVFNAKAYGAKGDGTSNDTTAVQAAINTAMANGGTVYFPPGTYLISGALTIPNDGATPPNQKPLRLTGALPDIGSTSGGKTPADGAILNLTETSNTVGKIDTRGSGYMEIDHLTLEDTAGDAVPFIHDTNTVLHVHDNGFVGSKITTACDQDAIVLGGSTDTADGTANGMFQGYGTVIRDNWFNKIRRAVFLAADANGVQVVDNTIWNESGSNLAGGAAFEISANGATNYDVGDLISGNLIELVGYTYGISVAHGTNNHLNDNQMYDAGANVLAGVYFASDATFNVVQCGYSGAKPCDVDNSGRNTAFDSTGDNPTTISLPWKFDETGGYVPSISAPSGQVVGLETASGQTNDSFSWDLTPGSSPQVNLDIKPTGGSPELAAGYNRVNSTWGIWSFGSYSDTRTDIHSSTGDLRLYAGGSSGVTWIGGDTSQPTYFSNNLMHVGTKAVFTGQIVQTPIAFASAPSCNSGNEGSIQAITDSTVNAWGSTIAGGGTNHVLGYCDGTNWTVAAK